MMDVMQRLADQGNSIICIEHNLDVIRCADWILDQKAEIRVEKLSPKGPLKKLQNISLRIQLSTSISCFRNTNPVLLPK